MLASLKARSGQWLDIFITALLISSVAILLVGLLSWQIPFGVQLQLQVGEVAPHDVVAPRQITYESQVLTERARERAAQSVPDQYDTPDGRVRRQQVERSREILDFITIVRSDPYASPELQIDYLLAIADLDLTPELALAILEASPEEWQAIVADVPRTLDRIMREEIRENTVTIARRRVPALVSAELSEEASTIVAELVKALIRPNSLFNQARTEELRAKARSEVPVQQVTLERNEIIVRAGDIATPEQVEALTQIGLIQSEWNWWVTARAIFFTVALMVVAGATLYQLRPRTLRHQQELAIVVVVVTVGLLAAKFMIVPHDWLPYLYPLAALSMLLAVLLDVQVAVVVTMAMALVVHYLSPNNVPLITYLCTGSLLGAVILGRAERLSAFLWAGMAVVGCNLLALASYRAPFTDFTVPKLLQLHLIVLLNGGLSASVALIGYFVLGNLFGIATSLQLTELSRPTHPLLRQLLLKASGTYHHTIIVSNLAERAAAAIGADAFLARVGAYYHDIGKTVRPYFFAENIMDGSSPHDKLDPLTSAQIIISHVADGLDLARKYHLPERIQDFIREHHGRSLVQYFYIQAQKRAEGEPVREEDFRYPGPSPRSKETAILLLADTCEAAVRAMRPANREELAQLVNRLIDERVADGELDHCNLTFKELNTIKEVFLHVLQGVHHPRIKYPENVQKAAAPTPETAPAGGNGHREEEPRSGSPTPSGTRLSRTGGVEEPASI
ncbi:MAG: phosphohydrolase [Litorilinea sp.]|nr:MAG: phosphohydrolase [Litorilinea sp.]